MEITEEEGKGEAREEEEENILIFVEITKDLPIHYFLPVFFAL